MEFHVSVTRKVAHIGGMTRVTEAQIIVQTPDEKYALSIGEAERLSRFLDIAVAESRRRDS